MEGNDFFQDDFESFSNFENGAGSSGSFFSDLLVGGGLIFAGVAGSFAEYLLDFTGNMLISSEKIKPSFLDGVLQSALKVARSAYLYNKYEKLIQAGAGDLNGNFAGEDYLDKGLF